MKIITSNEKAQMQVQDVVLSRESGGEMQQVKLYPEVTYQEIFGFGGAFTEAAAYVYSQMSEAKKEELVKLYFGSEGNQYNFCRGHIQSCDFALGNYAYVEDPEDEDLATFSIERDRKYILPLMKAALAKNKDIELLASPWSPSAFMKTNGEMNHGGSLKKEYYERWAEIMATYVDAYEKEGIKITRMTVQNEPAAVQTWDSCIYSGKEEAEFAVKALKPALKAHGHGDIKIFVWDHNKDIIMERVTDSFSVDGADRVVDGIAYHWYSGDHFEALAEVHRQHPDKELIFTEGCVEYSRFATDNQTGHAEMYAHDMIGDFKAGTNAFIDWNLYLDSKGGPNHVGNFCDAPVMVDYEKDEIRVNLSYYYIGHFSRFVQKGAKRILASSYNSNLETVAFANPDGSVAVIVLNRTERELEYNCSNAEGHVHVTIPAHSIQTILM